MTTSIETEPAIQTNTKSALLRHIVRQDATTKVWEDVTLCGKPWDVLKAPPNGTLCDECRIELERRDREGHP